MAEAKIEEIERLSRWYVLDFLQLLSYQIDKADVDKIEDEYQENIRKAKSKHK